MGRYYSGDINGKFWFAVQASNAADRFGSIGQEPEYLYYYFFKEHLDSVEQEIERIENTLGDKVKVLDNFFKENFGYNDEILEEMGIGKEDFKEYADLTLGRKIRDCIQDQGSCVFTAEL